MTIEQMREFVVLAEERNYLVAADILYSTQATLSRHIIAMEEELGFSLFNRSTKRIELTPEGSRFLLYARNAVRIQDNYRHAIEHVKNESESVLNIGYNGLVTFYHFFDFVNEFMKTNPGVRINVSDVDSDVLIRSVKSGALEMAFVQLNPFEDLQGLDSITFCADRLCAILPCNHRLAGKASIALSQLKDDNFILADGTPAEIAVDACRAAGFEPRVAQSNIVGRTMYEWIGGGRNVGLDLQTPANNMKNDRVRVVPLNPDIISGSCVIYRKGHLSPGGKQLAAYMRQKHAVEGNAK